VFESGFSSDGEITNKSNVKIKSLGKPVKGKIYKKQYLDSPTLKNYSEESVLRKKSDNSSNKKTMEKSITISKPIDL